MVCLIGYGTNYMTDRVFVDTNILVYAYDNSAGNKHTEANRILQELWMNGTGCLSIQVLQEFFVVLTNKINKPIDITTVKAIVSDLGYWTVHEPSVDDVLGAVDIQQQFGISFWDAMILQSALQLGCERMLSEDLSSGQMYDGVTIINPFN